MLTIYARGIAACQDLYYNGNPHQVEALLPLYSHQTALLAQQTGALQQSAARLASQAHQLACELATDREDFGTARQVGQQAFSYAQLAAYLLQCAGQSDGFMHLGYGYGWCIGSESQTHRQMIFHSGSAPGFKASFRRYPAEHVTIIVLSNLDTLSTGNPFFLPGLEALVFGEV